MREEARGFSWTPGGTVEAGKPDASVAFRRYNYGVPELLTDDAIAERLQSLDWSREGDAIVKTSVHKDFAAALAWVNRVGELAEARNHHPDIAISWNKVTLTLSTHSAGGLTEADMDLAGEIDGLG
jgi:4a-hydroxytetrahydrobiopterin dehydratase